ncbi:GNAT family N-acetyltransferase [Tistrella bauzanensis]|nr:GNAT family N-acetyltransferase [Tistrella bauzanensis]
MPDTAPRPHTTTRPDPPAPARHGNASLIRPLIDADAPALIDLIDRCWQAYPGCILDVDGELPELRAYASHVTARGGNAWVAVDTAGPATPASILAMAATMPAAAEPPLTFEVHKLYVSPDARRMGHAAAMIDRIIATARAAGAAHLTLWTDTRFTQAHAFYEARDFIRAPGTRALDDISRSVEYRYDLPLSPAGQS